MDEALKELAGSAGRAVESLGRHRCRRHTAYQCRLGVWTVVLGAFVAGIVTPISVQAETRAAPDQSVASCEAVAVNKLGPCLSPKHSPRR
ncbi:hypothetical protein [Sphaerisporangium rufum]|nr:hypothetical protein [Sphaerisporangium rufum]